MSLFNFLNKNSRYFSLCKHLLDNTCFELKPMVQQTSKLTFKTRPSESRRIDIFIKTDENVRKWNDFFVFMKKQMGSARPRTFNFVNFCSPATKECRELEEAFNVWLKGHITKSYDLLIKIYEKRDIESREHLLTTLQFLIFHSLTTKGKAVLKDVIQGTKKFSEETNEICTMVTVWYSLFTSEWHEDRILASDILSENVKLQACLENTFPLIGYYLLKSEDIINYQRLIEVALQFNLEKSTGVLLRALFTYYDERNYFKGMEVVYKCCEDLGIKLTADQSYKYSRKKKIETKAKLQDYFISDPENMKYKF